MGQGFKFAIGFSQKVSPSALIGITLYIKLSNPVLLISQKSESPLSQSQEIHDNIFPRAGIHQILNTSDASKTMS